MTLIKSILKLFLVFVLALQFVACDGNVDVNGAVDPNENPEILSLTMGPSGPENQYYIRLPLGVFGTSTADLEGATISIYLNKGLLVSELDAAEYYYAPNNNVILNLRPLSNGASLGILVVTADGGQIFFRGNVDQSTETQALVTIADVNVSPSINETPILDFIVSMQGQAGTASAFDVTDDYDVTYQKGEYSSDCTAEFVKANEFFTNNNMTTEQIQLWLDGGRPAFTTPVGLSQENGDLSWQSYNSLLDLAGVINSDGSFVLFDGEDYVNESNYRYILIEGQFNADRTTFSGLITARMQWNNQGSTVATATGSCRYAQRFTAVKSL